MKLAVVAADYTPGEADQLRRDMAAWRRAGAIEKHAEKLISRMQAKGIAPEFAERVFNQIRGFGEYGFPESHAASFALVAYLTAWLKHHYHDAFTAALLNAWPMGFYAPATIVDDARRHGVAVLPIDVARSAWHCTLEPAPRGSGRWRCAVRMGLRYVKGLAERDGEAITAARAAQPFRSVADLIERVPALAQDDLLRLAESGALNELAPDPNGGAGQRGDPRRRAGLWEVLGAARRRGRSTPLPLHAPDAELHFAPLDQFAAIAWDYAAAEHSTRGHPLEPLRRRLAACSLPAASEVIAMHNGSEVSYAGLVICRQRPGTAAGVVFMTLEDETGFVNLVVWSKVFRQYRPTILTTSFLGVSGTIQSQHQVVHIIARQFWLPDLPATTRASPPVRSHDFH